MAGCISKQYRERSRRLAPLLGLLVVAAGIGCAADKASDPADAARVTAVRFWSMGDTTRIAIEVSSEFHFKSERLTNPDRLFFDIFGAKPEMARRGLQTIPVDDAIVKQLRVAETQPGVTRVVIDLKQAAELSTSQLSNPSRLMVEVKLTDAKPADPKSKDKPVPSSNSGGQKLIEAAPENAAASGSVAPDVTAAATPAKTSSKNTAKSPANEAAAKAKTTKAPVETASVKESPKPRETLRSVLAKSSEAKGTTAAHIPPSETRDESAADSPALNTAGLNTASQNSVGQNTSSQNGGAGKSPALMASLPPEPVGVEPPSSTDDVKEVLPAKHGTAADSSLTRALGLKLGRVVIDPGHGGNDIGARGPSGYVEKDLTLDVSRRLAALIRDNMGSEVVLTRSDDVYVGLEERTRIANEHKADLFLSVHANSSTYRSAAGVETYVLSFTTSKTAMDLVSRENAGSELGIHELQDLLQKIALRDKVDESHELAARLQTSLSVLSAKSNDGAKNRGVKKAPFVVLIGANMPSVLAEIGFLTNSAEEGLLRKPEHRQKIAEALYKGISSYADTLSHLVARKN
jgi:N-acetylmuramoyl-L-alanine amidase